MAIQGELNTLINGTVYNWQESHIYMGNQAIVQGAFQELNYRSRQSSDYVQGNQVAPVGKSNGYGTVEGSFTMLIDDWDALNSAIVQLSTSGGTTHNTDFGFVISYAVTDEFIRTDTVNGIRITDAQTTKGSKDEIIKVCQFIAMQLLDNGVPAFTPGQSS